MSSQDKQTILRYLGRIDLYFLLRYVLNRPDVQHPWLFKRCREVQESPNGHLDLWAREHYKSTIITFAKTIQDVIASHGDHPLVEREATIGIFSHTRPNAKGFLRQIKREFEDNQNLKDLYPDIFYQEPHKESPKWSEDEGLVVIRNGNPKESTIEAHGLVDGQPTGRHFNTMVYDDVVTLESVRTSDMVKKTTTSWEMSLNLGAQGGCVRYVGTFYADGDTYHDLIGRGSVKPRIHAGTEDGLATGIPVLWDEETLAEKRQNMGPFTFATQILLDPIPDDNAYFQRDWFRRFDVPPKDLKLYGATDYAVTDGEGDFTEMGIGGIDPNDDLYLLDWWTGQTTADEWIEAQLDMTNRWKPRLWAGESGPIRRSVEPFLKKRMRERREYVQLEWMPSISDKPTRCRSFQARAASGKVYIPNTPWGDDLISQLMRFPIGIVDDKVDVCSLFGRILDKTWPAHSPEETENKPRDRWDRIFDDEEEDSWKTA